MGRALVNKGKKVNVKRRELVIPFDNEHLFTVPKRGGFGQPDNENYVMVTGGNVGNSPSPTDTTQTGGGVGTTTSTPATTQTQTPPITITPTPPISSAPTQPISTTTTPPVFTPITDVIPCTSFTYGSWSACNNGLQTRTYVGIPSGCTTSPSLTDTQARCTTDVLPTFPNWSSLDCTSLKDWIDRINSTLSTSRFTTDIANAYNNALASANATYTTKCYTNPNAIVVLPSGGIGGGGIGGGVGATDEEQLPQAEENKSNNGLFLILGIVGVLYFLTRKKN
jgi:hypothetical protein